MLCFLNKLSYVYILTLVYLKNLNKVPKVYPFIDMLRLLKYIQTVVLQILVSIFWELDMLRL